MHNTHNEDRHLKDQLEEKMREIRSLREENKRITDRLREAEHNSEKVKQDNTYLLQRTEGDISKMQ